MSVCERLWKRAHLKQVLVAGLEFAIREQRAAAPTARHGATLVRGETHPRADREVVQLDAEARVRRAAPVEQQHRVGRRRGARLAVPLEARVAAALVAVIAASTCTSTCQLNHKALHCTALHCAASSELTSSREPSAPVVARGAAHVQRLAVGVHASLAHRRVRPLDRNCAARRGRQRYEYEYENERRRWR